MSSTQELYGRKGTLVTDATAHDITRVEELAYDIRIEEVMTSEVHYLAPDAPISDLLELMRTTRISGAPVMEEGNLIGIVSLEDLIRALTEQEQSRNLDQCAQNADNEKFCRYHVKLTR